MDGGRLKHIYLIRHCQASGQEPTARLTPEGYRPAKGVADFFAGIGIRKCVSSLFVRVVVTIRPLCEAKNLEDVFRLDFLSQSFRGATHLWGGGT